jgi:hypothetical protein
MNGGSTPYHCFLYSLSFFTRVHTLRPPRRNFVQQIQMERNEQLCFRHTICCLLKMPGLPSSKIMERVQVLQFVVEQLIRKEENWEEKKGRPRRHIASAYSHQRSLSRERTERVIWMESQPPK